MSKELISVIVPIYNVEKYIRKCITSILNQSYTDLEIILVDDGSTDNCGAICDEYAMSDSRVKVVHKPNGGLSDARNTGLDRATGDFIGFVDSDDYIHRDMYKILYDNIKKTVSDIAECGVETIYSNRIVSKCSGDIVVYTGRNALKKHLLRNNRYALLNSSVCTKLFKASLMNNIRFNVGESQEDYYPVCQTLYNAQKVCVIDLCLYHYNKMNPQSITSRSFSCRNLDEELQYKRRMDFLEEKGDMELYALAEERYYELLLRLYYKCVISKMKESIKYRNMLYEHRSNIRCINFSYTRKLGFELFYISTRAFICLVRVYYYVKKFRK